MRPTEGRILGATIVIRTQALLDEIVLRRGGTEVDKLEYDSCVSDTVRDRPPTATVYRTLDQAEAKGRLTSVFQSSEDDGGPGYGVFFGVRVRGRGPGQVRGPGEINSISQQHSTFHSSSLKRECNCEL